MDLVTQAALGSLCGEIILRKKLGNKGMLWGALFGTLPDLDILAYPFLSFTEQLMWHRGFSHSILMTFIATFFFGWLLHQRYAKRGLTKARLSAFVFWAWATHILIDCFNTYGTQILEPFSHSRFSINNISIIDLFFTLPIIIGLIYAAFKDRDSRKRILTGRIVAIWLVTYLCLSLTVKHFANKEFEQRLADSNIPYSKMMTAPTFGNIFLWRMVAHDKDSFHVSYWSIFDQQSDTPKIRSFKQGHEIDEQFKDSEDFQTMIWFSHGWHKTYQLPSEPNSIYIAAVNMSEVRITDGDSAELRPAFLWKVTKTAAGFTAERPFKMSKDGGSLIKKAVNSLIDRIGGETDEWLEGSWTWDLEEKSQ